MEAREHSAASRTDYAMSGAAGGVIGGGLLGSVGGAVVGAITGLASSLLNPITVIGLIATGIGAATGGFTGSEASGLAAVPHAAAATVAYVGAGTAGVMATLHTVGGTLAGAGMGGGIGAGLFGVKGAFKGAGRANDESELYAQHKQAYKDSRQDAISNARQDAAEQYTIAGYTAAAQELGPYYYRQGQESVVQQIIAAKQRQMAMAGGNQSFVQMVGGRPADTHAQGVTESQAQAGPGTV